MSGTIKHGARARASVALAVSLLTVPRPARASPFADVPLCCYYSEALSELADWGVVIGDQRGRFRPKDFLTRGEAVTMCHRFRLKWEQMTGTPPQLPTPFPRFVDVPEDHWAKDAVDLLSAAGIIRGEALYTDVNPPQSLYQPLHELADLRILPPMQKLHPRRPLQRATAILWLARSVGFDLRRLQPQEDIRGMFLVDSGGRQIPLISLIEGFEDGTVRWNAPMRRQDVVMFMARLVETVRRPTKANG